MAKELRRLLIPPDRLRPTGAQGTPVSLALEPAETHYLARVLRFRPGDRLAVIDGIGHLWTAVLASSDRLLLEQPLHQPLQEEALPEPAFRLAMAIPKRDADLVWRMAAELGVSQLQPLLASRGEVRGALPLERWRTIVREATEQCERLWLPQLAEPLRTSSWFSAPLAGFAMIATTRLPNLPRISTCLARELSGRLERHGDSHHAISLAIGPEGGWTPEEEALACENGWLPVSLGPGILRTSTAAIAGLAVIREALTSSAD